MGKKKTITTADKCPNCGRLDLYEDIAGGGESSIACPCGFRYYGRSHPAISGENWETAVKKEKQRIRKELKKMGLVNVSPSENTCTYSGCKKKIKRGARYCTEHGHAVNNQRIREWQQENANRNKQAKKPVGDAEKKRAA